MVEKELRTCCYIGRGRAGCTNKAEFEIWNTTSGADPYDVTDGCEEHVGFLLGSSSTNREGRITEATSWTVVPIVR